MQITLILLTVFTVFYLGIGFILTSFVIFCDWCVSPKINWKNIRYIITWPYVMWLDLKKLIPPPPPPTLSPKTHKAWHTCPEHKVPYNECGCTHRWKRYM